MKAGALLCLLSLSLCSGCVDLNKPKALAECSKNGLCSDDPSVQTGGTSGGEPDVASDLGVMNDVAIGSGGAVSTGGASATGGMAGSGGLAGSGGVIAPDGSVGSGGVTGSGGRSSPDGAIGTGGVLGTGGGASGGTSSGGAVSLGGSTVSVDASSDGGAMGTGGVTGSGGSALTGGAVATGGATGSGGKTGSGGVVATGGGVGTGGSTITGCGTTKSTLSQTFNFATDLQALAHGPDSTGGSVKYVTTGPSSNANLCKAGSGCAALAMPFTSAAAYTANSLAVENFAPPIDLVGSTVTFSLAVDNPAQVPIQIQAYAQGDGPAYAWNNPATVGGASLLSYAASIGFKDLTLTVADFTSPKGKYCAALTGAIGIQLQNAASSAGTVTIYIQKITITPPL